MDNTVDDGCLKERKWWCFFLSSIVTFITGVASVLIVRAFNSVFRKKVSPDKNYFFYGIFYLRKCMPLFSLVIVFFL